MKKGKSVLLGYLKYNPRTFVFSTGPGQFCNPWCGVYMLPSPHGSLIVGKTMLS